MDPVIVTQKINKHICTVFRCLKYMPACLPARPAWLSPQVKSISDFIRFINSYVFLSFFIRVQKYGCVHTRSVFRRKPLSEQMITFSRTSTYHHLRGDFKSRGKVSYTYVVVPFIVIALACAHDKIRTLLRRSVMLIINFHFVLNLFLSPLE